jgi:hypothetical protein
MNIDGEFEGEPCERCTVRSTRQGSLGSQSTFTIKLNFRKASACLLR